ncbi:hypothetical protein BVY04_01005 [bacterium M21]|nr:hypothetical protein BVY04_01005 [bacterium M21]
MIVEIIGPSGAGKSFLALNVMRKLEEIGVSVEGVHEDWVGKGSLVPWWLNDPGRHNISTDLRISFWSMLFLAKCPKFSSFIIRMILSAKCSFYHKTCIARGLWRKAGMDQYFRRRKFQGSCVFIDEGICHSIHNFLVYPREPVDERAVAVFADTFPLPDVLACLDGSEEQLMDNLHERGIFSPRVEDEKDLAGFVRNSIRAFDLLMTSARVCSNAIPLKCREPSAVLTLVKLLTKHSENSS